MRVPRGRLISLPYSLEINDFTVLHQGTATPRQYVEMVRAQFDRLYAEGARSGTVLCLPLHPFLIGQPHRIDALGEMLAHITGHAGVWVTTAREIADHFYAQHYDQFASAIAARGGGRR